MPGRSKTQQTRGEIYASPGFTQGLVPEVYYEKLASPRWLLHRPGRRPPTRSGCSRRLRPDVSRSPIAACQRTRTTSDFGDDYWTWFFGEEPPFPVLTDYEQLPGYTEEALANWKPLSNRMFAWWMRKKRADGLLA